MPDSANCPLCRSTATSQPRTGDWLDYSCPRCGNYIIVDTAEQLLRDQPLQSPGAVSGWIRRQNSKGVTPNIRSDDVPRLRALTKPSFRERAEQYLIAVARETSRLNQEFKPLATELIGVSYSDDDEDLNVILWYLMEERLITGQTTIRGVCNLTPKGYITADELRARRPAATQAFVAMWFSEEMRQVYDRGFEPGIRNAGFEPMLLLNKEHANKIDDEIIAEIRRSAFLVADFTGHRQNVYLETGFALGLGLQVIWTCHKKDAGELHFDIRQYNYIDWENEAELARRLQSRIEALFGRGPLAPLTG
jgi:hypothetical protein